MVLARDMKENRRIFNATRANAASRNVLSVRLSKLVNDVFFVEVVTTVGPCATVMNLNRSNACDAKGLTMYSIIPVAFFPKKVF